MKIISRCRNYLFAIVMYLHRQGLSFHLPQSVFSRDVPSGCGFYFKVKAHHSAVFTVFGHRAVELLRQ